MAAYGEDSSRSALTSMPPVRRTSVSRPDRSVTWMNVSLKDAKRWHTPKRTSFSRSAGASGCSGFATAPDMVADLGRTAAAMAGILDERDDRAACYRRCRFFNLTRVQYHSWKIKIGSKFAICLEYDIVKFILSLFFLFFSKIRMRPLSY